MSLGRMRARGERPLRVRQLQGHLLLAPSFTPRPAVRATKACHTKAPCCAVRTRRSRAAAGAAACRRCARPVQVVGQVQHREEGLGLRVAHGALQRGGWGARRGRGRGDRRPAGSALERRKHRPMCALLHTCLCGMPHNRTPPATQKPSPPPLHTSAHTRACGMCPCFMRGSLGSNGGAVSWKFWGTVAPPLRSPSSRSTCAAQRHGLLMSHESHC